MTLGELLSKWQHAHRETWTPSNIANTKNIVARPLRHLHDHEVDRTSTQEIRRFYDRIKHTGLSDSYVGRIHSSLRSAMSWGVSEGLIATNPAAGVRRVAKKAKGKPVPSIEGVQAMMADSNDWVAAFLRFALETGARRGELGALRWSDITEAEGAYYRVTFVQRVSNKVIVPGLKASAMKTMLVSEALVDQVQSVTKSDVWVFGIDDRHGSLVSLSRYYRKARDKVLAEHPTMAGTTLHGLRHLCGSYMLAAGSTIPQVSAHLGHSSPAVTMGIYAHALGGDDTGAADLFSGI